MLETQVDRLTMKLVAAEALIEKLRAERDEAVRDLAARLDAAGERQDRMEAEMERLRTRCMELAQYAAKAVAEVVQRAERAEKERDEARTNSQRNWRELCGLNDGLLERAERAEGLRDELAAALRWIEGFEPSGDSGAEWSASVTADKARNALRRYDEALKTKMGGVQTP